MPVIDMPNVPPLDTPVIIARASTKAAAREHDTVRVCRVLGNPPPAGTQAVNTLTPATDVATYFYGFEKRTLSGATTVTVVEAPTHGKLEDLGTVAFNEMAHSVRDTGLESFNYLPDKGYTGTDHATMLVSIGDLTVKTEYVFQVAPSVTTDSAKMLCPKPFSKVSTVSVPTLGFGEPPGALVPVVWRARPQG